MKENDIKLLKQLEREIWSQYEHYDVILTVLIDKLERGILK